MTLLRKISLFHFKNYEEKSFTLDSKVTCISGPNGCGKTNLLDAIYILCYTKSYFSSLMQQMVKNGEEGFRIEGYFEKGQSSDQIVCKLKNGKKEFSSNRSAYEKYADHIGKYTAVMIAPDDIGLINEGSELRRKLIDSIIGQCNKNYLEALLVYQKTLLQRNAWLKMHGGRGISSMPDEMVYYNHILAQKGDYIHQCRLNFLQDFSPLLEKYYTLLAGSKEKAGILYHSDLLQASGLNCLEQSFSRDLQIQRTSKGIHRDDLVFTVKDLSLKGFGSQGQKKSFLFSIKLAQFEYISQQLGQSPLLLLDDVFEKLDQERMQALFEIFRAPHFQQIFISDTHKDRLESVAQKLGNCQHIEL